MKCALAIVLFATCLLSFSTATTDGEEYKVLKPGMHETLDCLALQEAINSLPASQKASKFFMEFAPKFEPALLECNLLASAPPILASIAGAAEELVKKSAAAVAKVKSWMSQFFAKAKTAVVQAANKARDFLKTNFDKLKHLVKFRQSKNDNSLDDLWPALVIGAREPDLPCEHRDTALENCLMAVAPGAGLADLTTVVLQKEGFDANTVDLISKTTEARHFSKVARASHFGYMSVGHGQTADRPGDKLVPGVVQILQDPSPMASLGYVFPLSKSTAPVAHPTQRHVVSMIVDLLSHWYTLALSALKNNDQRYFVFHLGRIGHAMGDSYSCAHTVRLADAKKGFPIVFLQDYTYQDGDQHSKNGDELPINGQLRTAGFQRGKSVVAHVYQIMLRAAIAQQANSAYVPISGKYSSGLAEMQDFLKQSVYHFAADYFANYPAGGCVTQDTHSATAVTAKKICPLAASKAALGGQDVSVCPDRPIPISKNFV